MPQQDLRPYHTFGLPVRCQAIVFAENIDDLQQAYQQAKTANLPFVVLGEGSDVLFTEDFHGIVALNRLKNARHTEDDHFHYFHLGAGENWHHWVQTLVAQGIGGLENLALIPGTVGAAPIQNIGAYGVEFKDVCDYVNVIDLENGKTQRLGNQDCQFAYRDSIFKQALRPKDNRTRFVITAVGLKLAKNWQPMLGYKELRELPQSEITPAGIFAKICAIRQSKLPDPKVLGNAGSFFKNPVVSTEKFAQLQQNHPSIPHYPQADGTEKLAAGWLIDQCGLKGTQVGGAAVHRQQALVLVNTGNATSQEITALAQLVQRRVAEKFGVHLVPEVRFYQKNGEIFQPK